MRPGDLCTVKSHSGVLWDSYRSPGTVIEELPRGSVVLVLNYRKRAAEVNILSQSGLVGWVFEGHIEVIK